MPNIFASVVFFSTLAATVSVFPNPAFKDSETSSSPNSHYLSLADSVDYYISREKWENAEGTMERMLRAEPANAMNVMVLSNLASVKIELKKYQEANQLADVVLSRAPESVKALNLKSSALIGCGLAEESKEYLRKSLRVDSLQTFPNEILGALSLTQSSASEAEKCYRNLLAKDSLNANYICNLGKSLLLQNKLEEAEHAFRKSLNIKEDCSTYISLLSLLMTNKKHQEAEEIVRKALDTYPESGDLYVYRTALYRLQFQPQAAEASLNLAKKYHADPQLIKLIEEKKRK